MQKIGDYLSNLEPTDEDKRRIREVIKNDNAYTEKIFNILLTTKTKTVKRLLDSKRIDGFRTGTKQFYKRALNSIFDDLKKGSVDKRDWNLYKIGVIEYVISHMYDLNELLISVDIDDNATTEDAFIEVCKNAATYDVDRSDIEKLYDIYFIPRLSNYSDLIKVSEEIDESIAILKELKDIKKRNEELEESLRSLEGEIDKKVSLREIKKYVDDQVSEISGGFITEESDLLALKHIEDNNELFDKKHELLEKKYTQEINHIKNIINHNLDKEELKISDLNDDIRKLKLKNKSIVSDLDNYKESIKSAKDLLVSKIETKLIEVKRDLLSDVSELIKANSLDEKIDRRHGSQAGLYVSPLLKEKIALKAPKDVMKKEIDFITFFYQKLLEVDDTLTVETAFIFHAIFKVAKTILLKDIKYYKVWLLSLDWLDNCMEIVASPIWSSEKEWYLGANHIYSTTDNTPSALCIYDYDAGLVEGYLYPTLKLSRISAHVPDQARLILIPASQENILYDSKVLEYGCMVDCDSYNVFLDANILKEEWRNCADHTTMKHKKGLSPGVSVSTFSQWNNSPEMISREEENIHITASKALDVNINLNVLDNYFSIKGALSVFLKNDHANTIALKSTLLPWVAEKYDVDKSKEYLDYIETL